MLPRASPIAFFIFFLNLSGVFKSLSSTKFVRFVVMFSLHYKARMKPGFHSNASACVGKQPIMVATASTEHSYWLALAFVAWSCQRKRLRLNGNRAWDRVRQDCVCTVAYWDGNSFRSAIVSFCFAICRTYPKDFYRLYSSWTYACASVKPPSTYLDVYIHRTRVIGLYVLADAVLPCCIIYTVYWKITSKEIRSEASFDNAHFQTCIRLYGFCLILNYFVS